MSGQSDPDGAVVRRRVEVSGRVQGVSFRDGTRREAEGAGVTGWVRNAADGSVEAELEGSGAAVEQVVGWMRQGPPAARVEHVDIVAVPPTEDRGFQVR